MKKRILVFFVLLSSIIGLRAQKLVIHHPGGTTTDVELSQQPRIEFQGDRVVVKLPKQDLDFASTDILRLTYRGSSLGDVNCDGEKGLADVMAMANYILGLKPAVFNAAAADVNGDKKVDITDVSRAIDGIVSDTDSRAEKADGSSQGIGDAFYVCRNNGEFNAFFREDVDSIAYSHYDADSVYYDVNVTQLVYTPDSLYRIPLTAVVDVDFCVNDITVSDDYLPVSEDGYTIVSADIEEGRYVLEFNGTVPQIEEGSVMTIIGDDISEMIRVLDVQINGQQVTLTSQKASMGDVFTSGSFTLSTEQLASASRSADFTPDGQRVYYPVEVSYYDEGNHRHSLSRRSPRKIEFEHNLYHYTIDYSGHDFYKNNYMRLYLETCRLDFDLSLIISCNFNSVGEGLDKWRKGELAMQKSVIRGSVDTDFMLRFDASGSKREDLDEIMLKKNLHKPITAKFVVAGVPVVVVMNTHLLADGSYDAEGNFSAYAGFATSTSAELGCSWSQAVGLKPYASFSNTFTMHDPTIEGSAHLEEKVSVFPRITFSVYGLLGPTFDIKPYLRQTLDLGFCDDVIASTGKDFYGAEYNLYAGYDAAVGLSFLSVAGNEPFVKSPSWKVAEAHVYEAPKKIKFEKASSETAVPDQPIDVSFRVTDYLHILKRDCNAALPMTVKFETNSGTLEHDFVSVDTSTGLATVTWTPDDVSTDGKDAYILAMMHDHNGRVTIADRWTPKKGETTCPDANHPHWIDLGLPSGTKWACCNVGASAPEQYGSFYAWGETNTKSVYNGVTYSYYNGSDTDGDGNIDENLSVVNIGSDIAGTQYDVATTNWGEQWQIPTSTQWEELIDNCTIKWITQDDINGREFTGPNGTAIFLPVAGVRIGWEYYDKGGYGNYWSSTLKEGEKYKLNAYGLHFGKNDMLWRYFGRDGGFSIRPVLK